MQTIRDFVTVGIKGRKMIDLYTWPTPNGHKVHIMLEECSLSYKVIPININKGDQFQPEFLQISPNNKMPAIVDHNGPDGAAYPIFESGAILMYLAEKTGQFMPTAMAARYTVIQWLMFQMGGVGPMLGQANHFKDYAPEKIPYAIDRYTNETDRLYGVLERRLGEARYLAGNDYSIADMAVYPWVRELERRGQDEAKLPNLKRWLDEIGARPAVVKGLEVLAEHRRIRGAAIDEETRRNMFGESQYQKR